MKTIASLILALLVTGCANTLQISQIKYPPKPVESVEVFYVTPTRSFEPIARVSSYSGPALSQGYLVTLLRQQAAAAGADALIVQGTSGAGFGDKSAGGIAIRWTPQVKAGGR